MSRSGVKSIDFTQLVKISGHISLRAPLVPETHHIVNADVFRQMKPTAYLINTARGPLVDEEALVDALNKGQPAGAALVALPQEPPPDGSPLFGRDNVILTPHMSFYSLESVADLQTKAAEEVVRVISGQMPRNPVNPEVLKPAPRT